MRIVNGTDTEISYELKGGPLKMTMSTCDLLPGEEEVWTSPYRAQRLDVACEVVVTVGDTVLKTDAPDHATVTVEGSGDAVTLKVDA